MSLLNFDQHAFKLYKQLSKYWAKECIELNSTTTKEIKFKVASETDFTNKPDNQSNRDKKNYITGLL